jgi:hypothetical protein
MAGGRKSALPLGAWALDFAASSKIAATIAAAHMEPTRREIRRIEPNPLLSHLYLAVLRSSNELPAPLAATGGAETPGAE